MIEEEGEVRIERDEERGGHFDGCEASQWSGSRVSMCYYSEIYVLHAIP